MGWTELPDIIRLFVAMAFVLSLMGGLALALKKLGLSGAPAMNGKKKRLKLVEALALDSRHRAVLIQRDDKQHLVILGPNGETVVETNIKPVKDDKMTNV